MNTAENCSNCHACDGEHHTRMILCPDCGNKRCPKATDHRLACSGSNDPGQRGSVYGDVLPETAARMAGHEWTRLGRRAGAAKSRQEAMERVLGRPLSADVDDDDLPPLDPVAFRFIDE